MTATDDTVYRVLRLPTTLKTAMKESREASGQTNAEYLAHIVDNQLPQLVEQLGKLGFGQVAGKVRPSRLPFSETAGTWANLRDASEQVQIPATQLLQICLASAVGEATKMTRRRKSSRRKKAKVKKSIRSHRASRTS